LSSFWKWRDRSNVLFLTYEEMKPDLAATVRRIASFMAVDLSQEEIDTVVRVSSFDYMKKAKLKFDPGQVVPWGSDEGIMLRRGERGSSGDFLTPAQQQRIDDHCKTELLHLGCDFAYDEAFITGS
jgi:aryl sulfotransferase